MFSNAPKRGTCAKCGSRLDKKCRHHFTTILETTKPFHSCTYIPRIQFNSFCFVAGLNHQNPPLSPSSSQLLPLYQYEMAILDESCATCARYLSNIIPQYDEKSEKPKAQDRRLDCCGRVVCGNCIHVRTVPIFKSQVANLPLTMYLTEQL
jgi:hypothetical protein